VQGGLRLDLLAQVLPHPLDRPVPHPTTLSKLVRRAGPGVIAQLNAALLAKLAADKLLRARKLRIDTTVVEADIDYPTDADLLAQAVRTLGGLVRRLKARGAAPRTAFRDRSRSAGRRLRQLTHSLRRRSGVAMGEVDRLTAQVATIARQSLREVAAVRRAAHHATARRPGDGWLARLAGQLDQTVMLTGRLLWQTGQRLAGNRSIPDRLVSLADPDARPIRKGKPRSPTQFGDTLLLAEDERGFVADHLVSKGNPADAPQLLPAVRRAATLQGRPPGTVVADRGFGFAANDRAWPSSACGASGCSAPARPAGPVASWSRPGRSNGCATGAWGSRRASATSSARSGCGAPGCGAYLAPRPGSGWGLRLQPAAHDVVVG
jgi:transposase, IS5 family